MINFTQRHESFCCINFIIVVTTDTYKKDVYVNVYVHFILTSSDARNNFRKKITSQIN